MEILFIVIAVGLSIAFYFIRSESHADKIKSYVESMGGKLIDYETGGLFKGMGPFMVVGKGRVVYRVNYEINGQIKEGWVRFGGIGGPDWRF